MGRTLLAGGALLVVALQPVRGVSLGAVALGNLRLPDLALGAVVLFLIFRTVASRRFAAVDSLLSAAFVLVVLFTLSLGWAADEELALSRILSVARSFVLFLVVRAAVRDAPRRRIVQLAVVTAAASMVLVVAAAPAVYGGLRGGLYGGPLQVRSETSLESGSEAVHGLRSAAGLDALVSDPSQWLVMAVVLGMAAVALARTRALRLVLAVAVIVESIAVFALLKRTEILGLTLFWVAAVLLTWKFRPRLRLRAVAAVVSAMLLIGGVAVVLGGGVAGRLRAATEYGDWAVAIRLEYYRQAWEAVCSSPFVGVGVGNVLAYRQIVHNLPLQILAELGILGLAALGWLLAAWLALGWRQLRAAGISATHLERLPWAACTAGAVAYVAMSLATNSLEEPYPWIMMAVVSGAASRATMLTGSR